jgi:hypothetical protein
MRTQQVAQPEENNLLEAGLLIYIFVTDQGTIFESDLASLADTIQQGAD